MLFFHYRDSAANDEVLVYLHYPPTSRKIMQGAEGWEYARMTSGFRTSNGQMLLAAARAGLGVTCIPRFIVEDSARGEVEAVLPVFLHKGADLHIFMPAARSRVAMVRALVNFLYDELTPEI